MCLLVCLLEFHVGIDVAGSVVPWTLPSLCHYAPLICVRHGALQMCFWLTDFWFDWCQLAAWIMHMADELGTWMSTGDNIPRIWACFGTTGVDTKFNRGWVCRQVYRVYVCDFHVNWVHVSRTWRTDWRRTNDWDINRRRLISNVRCVVCVWTAEYLSFEMRLLQKSNENFAKPHGIPPSPAQTGHQPVASGSSDQLS